MKEYQEISLHINLYIIYKGKFVNTFHVPNVVDFDFIRTMQLCDIEAALKFTNPRTTPFL